MLSLVKWSGDGLVRKATTCAGLCSAGQDRADDRPPIDDDRLIRDRHHTRRDRARHTIRPLDSCDQLGNIRLASANCNCWTVGPI